MDRVIALALDRQHLGELLRKRHLAWRLDRLHVAAERRLADDCDKAKHYYGSSSHAPASTAATPYRRV